MWGLWHRGDFHQEIRFYKLCVLVSLPKVSLPHEHTHGERRRRAARSSSPTRSIEGAAASDREAHRQGTAGELPEDGGAAEGARGPTGEDALGLTMLGGWQ